MGKSEEEGRTDSAQSGAIRRSSHNRRYLPEDIAADIEKDKKEACSKTGKIIIATAKNEKGGAFVQRHDMV